MKLSNDLWKFARELSKGGKTARDLSALASLDPKRIMRRLVNTQIGRLIHKVTKGFYWRK